MLRYSGQMLAETNRAAALGAEEASALRLTLMEKEREQTSTRQKMTLERVNREMDWKLTAEEIKWKLLSPQALVLALGIIGTLDPTPICDGTAAGLSLLMGNKLDAAEYGVSALMKVGGLWMATGGIKLAMWGRKLCTVARIGHGVVGSYRAYAAYQEGDWMQLGFSAVSFLKALKTACFAAGTQVVVGVNEDGSFITKSIEEVQVGDWVLSQDQNDPTAPPELRQVTAVEQSTVYSLRIVRIRDEETGDIESIRCTEEHPFWTEGEGWVGAESLQTDDRLLNPDGTFATIVSNEVEAHPEGLTVYNLTVDGDHTYFVEDGQGLQSPVWVHNRCNGHHPFAKYLGGDAVGQRLYNVDETLHSRFHSSLCANLRNAGITQLVSAPRSRQAWEDAFRATPGLQERAIRVLKQTARQFDRQNGTQFWGYLKASLDLGKFTRLP